jgi:hypothetical protein
MGLSIIPIVIINGCNLIYHHNGNNHCSEFAIPNQYLRIFNPYTQFILPLNGICNSESIPGVYAVYKTADSSTTLQMSNRTKHIRYKKQVL